MNEYYEAGFRLQDKIRNFDGNIVFLERGQEYFLRQYFSAKEWLQAQKDCCENSYQTKDQRYKGALAFLRGKIIHQQKWLSEGEVSKIDISMSVINKPPTFPMGDEEKKLIATIDQKHAEYLANPNSRENRRKRVEKRWSEG